MEMGRKTLRASPSTLDGSTVAAPPPHLQAPAGLWADRGESLTRIGQPVFLARYGLQRSFDMLSSCRRTSRLVAVSTG